MVKTLRSEEFYQNELQTRIDEKEKQVKSGLSSEEREVLEQEIQELNRAFGSIHPAVIDEKEFRDK